MQINAETILELRIELDLTLSQFGEMIGVSAMSVSRWERGINTPSRTFIKKLENILNGGLEIEKN